MQSAALATNLEANVVMQFNPGAGPELSHLGPPARRRHSRKIYLVLR